MLPVTIINFNAKLLPDQTVQLKWEAYTDAKHDFFEIEKSIDGRIFQSIGRVNTDPPFIFPDASPSFGSNLYRLKHVDKDGSFSYSNIVNIILANKYAIDIYPNPVNVVMVFLSVYIETKVTV